ncbi:response regulator transcription factor [Ginsengibacter hankyongi]|uniref:Response regulator transcription factor n=1 Tax=Ginsengibacter hankyongi TaxID=2607284 RepID=A0A5J5IFV5_9BACT|nr:response regulator transcription factor [Ginsengibacter hankyongi]KAA9038753.1 response regulator transcription factor [Ginsengibacter hankyongi]
MIKILIADDHAMVREGLKIYMQNVVAHASIEEACDGNSAFEKIKQNDYALIVLDITMPATDVFCLVSDILKIKPYSRILIFTITSEEVYAKKLLTLGAMGYLNKEADSAEIKKAITNVINGNKYLSLSLTDSLVDSAIHNKPTDNPFDLLTPRELQVARYLMNGSGISEIGTALQLHSSTIGTHKAKILQKLRCTNIVEIHQLGILYNIIKNEKDNG